MVNFKFLFKLDLIDISSIDFYFSDSYETLETNPILTKRYPTAGTVSYGAIYMPVENEEIEELPDIFYAEAVINFNDNTSIKAHARTLKNQEALLTTILNDGDEDIDVKFHIDESSGGGTNYSAGNGIDITNGTISVDVKNDNFLDFNEGALELDTSNLGTNEDFRQSLAVLDVYNDPYALVQRGEVIDTLMNDAMRLSATVKTDLAEAWGRSNIGIYPRIKIEGEYTDEQQENTILVLYENTNYQGTVVKTVSAFSDNIDLSQGKSFKIYTTLQNSYKINVYLYNPPVHEYDFNRLLNKKQNIINTSNKLNADYIQNGSNYMIIPKPSAEDAGKVLQVNSNGQPEWVSV